MSYPAYLFSSKFGVRSKVLDAPDVKAAFKDLKKEMAVERGAGAIEYLVDVPIAALCMTGSPWLGLLLGLVTGTAQFIFRRDMKDQEDQALKDAKQSLGDSVRRELTRIESDAHLSPAGLTEFRKEMKSLTKKTTREKRAIQAMGLWNLGVAGAILATSPFGWGVACIAALYFGSIPIALEKYSKAADQEPINKVIAQFNKKLRDGLSAGVYGQSAASNIPSVVTVSNTKMAPPAP